MIKDSGDRTEFTSGAVRDMHEGKGRCDLMPLDVVAESLRSNIIHNIAKFQEHGTVFHLYSALSCMSDIQEFGCQPTMFLETAVHFEQGAKKYGEYNWQKGIPVKSYIDSALRHYLKWIRGDDDERHDRAFCWNIMCAIWTCEHKPELNDYAPKKVADGNTCVCCGRPIPEGWQVCPQCERGD